MRYSLFLSLIIGFAFTGCRKNKTAKDTPKCVNEVIKEQKKNICADEGSTVNEYSFQDETVYKLVIAKGCFGGATKVFDAECNILAEAGGGISYSILDTVNGESFSKAEFVRQIWEK